jgi:hypothetical protein
MKVFIFCLLSITYAFAQTTTLKGEINCDAVELADIAIYNMNQQKFALSKRDGSFEIEAAEGDLLTFQAVHLDFWRQSVKANDIEKGIINIKMTEKTTELEAIEIVEYPKLNAKDLGIINYTPKKYTPAERRLRPAIYTKKDFLDFITLQSNTIPLDPIIYWLTGQTKKLKTNLKIEQKQLLIEELSLNFEESYFTNDLKIESHYVNAFLFYVVEDQEFVNIYKTKDKTNIKWQLTQLSITFKKLVANE